MGVSIRWGHWSIIDSKEVGRSCHSEYVETMPEETNGQGSSLLCSIKWIVSIPETRHEPCKNPRLPTSKAFSPLRGTTRSSARCCTNKQQIRGMMSHAEGKGFQAASTREGSQAHSHPKRFSSCERRDNVLVYGIKECNSWRGQHSTFNCRL